MLDLSDPAGLVQQLALSLSKPASKEQGCAGGCWLTAVHPMASLTSLWPGSPWSKKKVHTLIRLLRPRRAFLLKKREYSACQRRLGGSLTRNASMTCVLCHRH